MQFLRVFNVLLICACMSALAKKCGNNSFPIYKTGLQRGDIQQILDLHNKHRQLVASGNCKASNGMLPKACNMSKMVWDQNLASWAQVHADGCAFDHWNPSTGPKRMSMGQNLYLKWSTSKDVMEKSDWPMAIKFYTDEDKLFDGRNRKPFQFAHEPGHFTQLAWAKTYKVGCAATWFENSSDNYHKYRTLYTCQYWPSGNIIGGSMYETGSCGKCKKDKTYPDLCVV